MFQLSGSEGLTFDPSGEMAYGVSFSFANKQTLRSLVTLRARLWGQVGGMLAAEERGLHEC